MFEQLAADLLQTAVLPREIYEVITKQRNGSSDGDLRARLCALIFLIGKLSREGGADLGIRATADILADLLVEDLPTGSAELRKRIPAVLQQLVDASHLMQIGDEYRLQTRESSAWEGDFCDRLAKILNDPQRVANDRADLFRRECMKELGAIKLLHGESKVPRQLTFSFDTTSPAKTDQTIPVWIRDGWNEDIKSVEADARAAGNEDPTIFVFLPRRSAEALARTLAGYKVAEETLHARGVPTTPEGHEARLAMETRRNDTAAQCQTLIGEVLKGVQVFQSGGQPIQGLTLRDMVESAADYALTRLFPEFATADNPRWERAVEQAKKGSGTALEAIGHRSDPAAHPVCAALLKFIAGGKKGNEIRKTFESSPYGWSRDAVDGGLYAPLVSGHLRASVNGQLTEAAQLDRAKIGATDFRVEITTVTAAQRIAVRKLLQEVSSPYKPNEEGAALPALLSELQRRAEAAGGEAPLPAWPNTAHLTELLSLTGNDQLVAVYNQREQLTQEAKTWKKTADDIAKRLPQWRTLQDFLQYCTDLPAAGEIRTQAEAIVMQRSLLADPDPVPGLSNQLTQLLREELVRHHGEYSTIYNTQLKALQTSTEWNQLNPTQQQTILDDNDLSTIPPIRVGTETEVLTSLNSISLNDWKTRIDALSQRFVRAQLAAAKLLEPQAVHVTLPSVTLKTEEDVDAWLSDVRQKILAQLKRGPVVI